MVVGEKETDVGGVKDSQKFEVHCSAGDAGELSVRTDSVSIKVGQCLRMDGAQRMCTQSASTLRYMKTALSLFVSWSSTQIGMSLCKSRT